MKGRVKIKYRRYRGPPPYLQLISRFLHALRQDLFLAQAPRQSLYRAMQSGGPPRPGALIGALAHRDLQVFLLVAVLPPSWRMHCSMHCRRPPLAKAAPDLYAPD